MSRIPVIEVKNVTKRFNYWEDRPRDLKLLLSHLLSFRKVSGTKHEWTVLEDVSFNIMPGEFVGIMGRNGVGKSTILKIISGIYSPTEGQVITRGSIAPVLELGAGFSDELSGYENIFLNASVLGFGRRRTQEVLESIVEFSELGDQIYKPVRNYSSGMLVRLAFSIACHLDAPILLFDEVLAVGDLGFQAKCLDRIQKLYRDGRSIVLVTHSPEQVKRFCKRCILIDNKRVVFDGDAQLGAERYMSSFG